MGRGKLRDHLLKKADYQDNIVCSIDHLRILFAHNHLMRSIPSKIGDCICTEQALRASQKYNVITRECPHIRR